MHGADANFFFSCQAFKHQPNTEVQHCRQMQVSHPDQNAHEEQS